jgi:pimeloyl-ACP methyl ester carboxylesterase
VRTWIAAASFALFVLAWVAGSRLEPERVRGLLQTSPPTPYIHYLPHTTLRADPRVVLVVHGLDSSKEVMQIVSAALVDGGFEVYNIDLPGHGDSPARFEGTLANETIRSVLATIGAEATVLGHSLGAGLLLDLAEDQHFSTMVLLSPPPIPLSKVLADRVLLITGAYDVGRIRAFAPLVNDIGSPRIEWWNLRWAAHSSAIFNPVHVRRIVDWLGGQGANTKTGFRLITLATMLISGIVFGICLLPGTAIPPKTIPITVALVQYIAACGMAILALKVFIPLAWLRLFATDYLISFFFVTGLILCVLTRPQFRMRLVNVATAVSAAAFVIVVLGWIAGSHVLHSSLTQGRWWRFPVIAGAGLPLFLVDEMTIRKIHPMWKSIALALMTRILLWAFLITGVLLLNRRDAFLVLIAHLMVFFWIALWFGAHVVHRRTQDPFAAALFAALVQGWAFAAWFVIR